MFVIIILMIVTILLIYGKYYLNQQRLLKFVHHLPTGNELPLVGVGHRFLGKSTVGIMKVLINMCNETENPSRRWLGSTLLIIVSSPEDFQTVLNSPNCLEKPYVYRFIGDNIGLFTAPADIWKVSRKLINPTFNNKILLSFIPVFNQKSKLMTENMVDNLGQKDAFDIFRHFYACSLDMVCSTTLGTDLNFLNGEYMDVLESMEKITEIAGERMTKIWLHPDFIFRCTNLAKLHTKLTNTITALPIEIRKIRQKEYLESNTHVVSDLNEDEFYKTPQIVINELLKLHTAGLISDRMLDDQIMTMIAGGSETTALTASNVILMLAIHQDIQEKVFQEIKSAHFDQMSDTDSEVMTNLNYLEIVIKETMRLFPVAPFLGRECVKDTKISKCTVPSGALILMAVYNLHHHEHFWGPNPEEFNPYRFLPDKMADRHPYSYLPFSGGTRNCIGIKYGWMAMKVMISTLLRRFKFTTDLKLEDIILKWNLTLKIGNGHMVQVEDRAY